MESKVCIGCLQTLPIERFKKNRTARNGYRGRCRRCDWQHFKQGEVRRAVVRAYENPLDPGAARLITNLLACRDVLRAYRGRRIYGDLYREGAVEPVKKGFYVFKGAMGSPMANVWLPGNPGRFKTVFLPDQTEFTLAMFLDEHKLTLVPHLPKTGVYGSGSGSENKD